MDAFKLERLIRELLSLQVALYSRICTEYGNEVDWEIMTGIPKSGSVEFDSETWNFRKHGSGLEFKASTNQIVIDMHRFVNHPEVFDMWRLQTFLESKGCMSPKESIAISFSQLLDNKTLERDADERSLYRLPDTPQCTLN